MGEGVCPGRGVMRVWRDIIWTSLLAARKLEEGRMHVVLPTACEVCLKAASVPRYTRGGKGRASAGRGGHALPKTVRSAVSASVQVGRTRGSTDDGVPPRVGSGWVKVEM